MEIDYFIVCHDQNIIIDQIEQKKYKDLPNYKYLFVGNGPSNLLENLKNVIICKNLPNNIEEFKQLLTFTAWYAIVNNKLSNSKFVCILEYDIDIKQNYHQINLNKIQDSKANIYSYFRENTNNLNFLRSTPWLDILVRQIFDFKNVDDFAKKCNFWYPTTNCLLEKSILFEFANWFFEQIKQFKNYKYISYVHERAITIFAWLREYKIDLIENALVHNQKCSHNFLDIIQKSNNEKNELDKFYLHELENLAWEVPIEEYFDEKFYYEKYPDIRNWYVEDASKSLRQRMFHHYFLYGKKEGRIANAWEVPIEEYFDEKFYYEKYPDLKEYFTGYESKSLKQRMFHHYFLYGKKEGRFANAWEVPIEEYFDEKFYYDIYEDVRNWYVEDTSKSLKQRMFHHYFLHGKKEGRFANIKFNKNKNNLLNKIDLICFYTDSHKKILFEYLIPSLGIDDGFNLVLLKGQQRCPTASYYESGWFDTVAEKILSLMSYLDKIKENKIFVFTDPDVIFLRKCSSRLIELINTEKKEILFQDDQKTGGCTGFFVAKKTEKLMTLLNTTVNFIKDHKVGDQKSLNTLLKTNNFDISTGFLPINEFSNYGSFVEDAVYDKFKKPFNIPEETKVFHANRCKGLSHKYELLDYVKKSTSLSTKSFVFAHDQEIVLKYIETNKFDLKNINYVFLGNDDCSKIKNFSNVIIARELEYNIEQFPSLCSYTGWYAIWKNNLYKDGSKYIHLFEYDINLFDNFEELFQQNARGFDVIGYHPCLIHHLDILGRGKLMCEAIKSIYNLDVVEFISKLPKDHLCSVSTNHSIKTSAFEEFMIWSEPFILETNPVVGLSRKNDERRMGDEFERAIIFWYILKNMNCKIIDNALKHYQVWWGIEHSENYVKKSCNELKLDFVYKLNVEKTNE